MSIKPIRNRGLFVLSQDCEMLWGMRDHETKNTYGEYVVNGHATMIKVLSLFKKYNIHCTWGYVGLCIPRSKREIENYLPHNEPSYNREELNNYSYLRSDYTNEGSDDFYYSGDVINEILKVEGQEIGSHSFSHYYCMEEGQTIEQFRNDIKSSVEVIHDFTGSYPKSFIFPRNQVNDDYLCVLKEYGFVAYRGEQRYYTAKKTLAAKVKRALYRYVSLFAKRPCYELLIKEEDLHNIPLSCHFQFFRGGSEFLNKLQLLTIKRTMTYCAQKGLVFHLGFHPHNLGMYTDKNLEILEGILQHYTCLQKRYDFKSVNMAECFDING